MFKFKTRIVIRAFTLRRDVASASLLAKCLEYMGCEVLIASIRDFEKVLKNWQPDIAVVNIPQISFKVKSINKKIRTVWIDGEGFLPEDYKHHRFFEKNIEMLKSIDLILLWGIQVSKEFKNTFTDKELPEMHIIGYPALDLIKYSPNYQNRGQSKSIGFSMRSPYINDHLGRSVIRVLGNKGYLPRVVSDCRGFVATLDSIRLVLNNTDFNVSIRPHPYEQVDNYNEYKSNWFGEHASRVYVDDKVSYSEWASQQKLIISTSSFSLLQTYLLGIPTINIDCMAKIDDINKNYDKFYAEWQKACLEPKSTDEFVKLIKNNKLKFKKNIAIENQLKFFCNWNQDYSSNWMSAKLILKLVDVSKPINIFRVPTFLINLIDMYSFWRACKKNKLHPNYHYKKGYHKEVKDLDLIFENILNKNKGYNVVKKN